MFLKPMDQKRYACSSWLMHGGSVLRLCNLRMCRSCCHRYLEQWDEIQYDDADSIKSMRWDAEMIIKKRRKEISEVKDEVKGSRTRFRASTIP